MASSSVSKGMMAPTGPKISSRQMRGELSADRAECVLFHAGVACCGAAGVEVLRGRVGAARPEQLGDDRALLAQRRVAAGEGDLGCTGQALHVHADLVVAALVGGLDAEQRVDVLAGWRKRHVCIRARRHPSTAIAGPGESAASGIPGSPGQHASPRRATAASALAAACRGHSPQARCPTCTLRMQT